MLIQDEKKAIQQEIALTRYVGVILKKFLALTSGSTAKLAPPMNETELIQSLVRVVRTFSTEYY
jgi:hypothetical protein